LRIARLFLNFTFLLVSSAFLSACSVHSLRPVPFLSLSGSVIGLSYDQGKKWFNPVSRAEQNLPDQLEVSPTTGVAIVTRGYDVKEFTDYVKEEHRWSSFKIGFFGLGFDKSKEAGSVQSLLEEGGSTVFVAERNFQLYDVASYPYDLLDMPSRNSFVNSVNQLPSTCGSDSERAAYRQTIGFFGTHFFTQATYGGQMKYLISTKNTYVHRKTMSYIIKQVSFFIGILDFGLKFNSGSNTTEIRIDEEFLQMSTVTLVLNGGTHQFDGLTIRQWLSTVIASPSVIRASLRPLNELVNDDAKASCLSQAINAYMSDGNDNMGKRSIESNPLRHTLKASDALRWAVRNSEVGAKKRSVVAELGLESAAPGMLPGSHWMGMSIDAATGIPQVLPAIRTTPNKPATDCSSVAKCGGCWTNPFVGQTYRIPDQVCFKPMPEFLMVNASQEINKLENIKYFYEKVTKKKGFLGLSSKTETYRRTIENQYKRNEALSYFYVFLSWYEISLPPFPPAAPHPVFQAHYQSLPPTWNADKNSYENKAYSRFLDYWGTHFVDSASVGGSMKQETWYHKCFLSSSDEEYRNKQKKSSFIIATKRSGETTETETVDSKWSEYSRQTIDFQGGRAYDFDANQWQDWLGTIYENPAPIYYGMTELSTLLPSGPVKDSLTQAIRAYLAESEADAQSYPLQFANIQNNDRPAWCNA
jgi:hypothetical protein